MMTEKELQDAVELARKRYEAARWMKLHGVPRIDRLPHYVAVRQAGEELTARQMALIEAQ